MSEINYSASTPKKQYTRRIGDNGFLGADFSTAPIFASDRRFRDLKNVWKDYKSGSGVAIETVPGYRKIQNSLISSSSHAINGIYPFSVTAEAGDFLPSSVANGTWIGVHIGTELHFIKPDDESTWGTSGVAFNFLNPFAENATFDILPNYPSYAIQCANSLLIFCNGDAYIARLAKTADRDGSKHERHYLPSDTPYGFYLDYALLATGRDYLYVPTTYVDGEPYEQKNMLDARSKEIYHVTTIQGTQYDPITSDPSYYYYVRCVLHEKVKATTSSPYTGNIVSFKIDGTSQTPYPIVSNGYITELRFDYTGSSHQNEDHTVEVEYASDPAKFTSYRDFEDYKDKSTFNEGNPDYSGTAYAAIAGCTICATFDERVFLSGNPNLPNTVFYTQRDLTGYNNPTYFGVLNYNNLGTSNAPIKAMIPSANALYVLKDDSATDPTMYVLSGLSTEKDLIPRIYTVESGLPGIGCKGAACNFLDDIVFMSRNGVIGIDKQAVNLERTLGDRSALINGKLLLEDVTQAVFAEAEGYLWCLFKNNGHVYLADSRAYTQGAGYEWYYIDSVGSWSDDYPLYHYSDDIVERYGTILSGNTKKWYSPASGAYLVPKEDESAVDEEDVADILTIHDDTLDIDIKCILAEARNNYSIYYQVKPTGEKVGGTFHPATCMVASNDRIFFGTDNGDLLTFNNDKRGVQAESEIAVRAEDNPNGDTDIYEANRYPFLLRPEWYSFCGHRIESFVETSDDDGGIGNVTKDTVRRSAVVDMKAMLGSSWTITVYTDRDNGQPATVATGAMDDATQTTFEGVNFNGGDHVITQIRERSRKWVHKRYRVESNGFRCPFGLYRITYNFEINGRIK